MLAVIFLRCLITYMSHSVMLSLAPIIESELAMKIGYYQVFSWEYSVCVIDASFYGFPTVPGIGVYQINLNMAGLFRLKIII